MGSLVRKVEPQGPLQTLKATSPLIDGEFQDGERSRNMSRVTGSG